MLRTFATTSSLFDRTISNSEGVILTTAYAANLSLWGIYPGKMYWVSSIKLKIKQPRAIV